MRLNFALYIAFIRFVADFNLIRSINDISGKKIFKTIIVSFKD